MKMLEIVVQEIRGKKYSVCPVRFGLTTSRDPDRAYIQCIDPRALQWGSVVFECGIEGGVRWKRKRYW
jgi:hypothetical protein